MAKNSSNPIPWLLIMLMSIAICYADEFMLLSNNGFDSIPLISLDNDITRDRDVNDATYDWYNTESSNTRESPASSADQYNIGLRAVRRLAPPLPRIGRHLLVPSHDDLVTWTASQSKLRRRRSTPDDDIHHGDVMATRAAPLPRLGFRRSAIDIDERSVPLPRIGRYINTKGSWRIDDDEYDASSSGIAPPLPRLGLEFKQYERAAPLLRVGIRSNKPLPRLGRQQTKSLDLLALRAAAPLPRIGRQTNALRRR